MLELLNSRHCLKTETETEGGRERKTVNYPEFHPFQKTEVEIYMIYLYT